MRDPSDRRCANKRWSAKTSSSRRSRSSSKPTSSVKYAIPNGKWRVCIDYTDLNKACPKDHFPLPRIDQIVDSTAGCDLLCFLDAYSRYHHISMCREDEDKTAFVMPSGVYCYTCMPFGLKNAGPTYQRCMQ